LWAEKSIDQQNLIHLDYEILKFQHHFLNHNRDSQKYNRCIHFYNAVIFRKLDDNLFLKKNKRQQLKRDHSYCIVVLFN